MADTSRLKQARALVRALERGNETKANDLVRELANGTEFSLFQEVGKLTRQLHDTLVNVEQDSRLVEIAGSELPDARARLDFVINKTEAAVHRTLNAVETLLLLSEKNKAGAENLSDQWFRFTRGEMAIAEFKALCHDITRFLEDVNEFATKSHGNLSEILMAQDYQDLTGQVIRRVIDVVQEVENKLVDLIRLSGGKLGSTSKLKNGTEAEGPQIGPTANAQVVANQDDVDDLLSSLGF